MNHHLAIKSHGWSCNLEHTKKKHWLIHVTVSEHSTFPCETSVRLGRVRCNSVAKLEECSWWIYLPTSRQAENLSSVQPEGKKVRKALVVHFGIGCPSGWSGTCHQIQLWLLHWCCHLQRGHLPTGIWAETTKLSQFQEQLSETTPLAGFYTVTWGLGPDPNPLRVFPSSMPVRETRDITKSTL